MKIYKNLYWSIISPASLFHAWDIFKNDKRNRLDVANFEFNLEDNIFKLYRILKNETYKHESYVGFWIHDPKLRRIHKATVRDRVLHHAIFRVLNPVFEPTFISDSFSCRINKGTHKGVKRLSEMLQTVSRNNTRHCYALKCDIQKFFDSIDHDILFNIVSKKIKDEKVLKLLKEIIESFNSNQSNLFESKGVPIGNLTSQIFANIYMNEFDQYIKQNLKVKNYVRYTDDFVLVSSDKEYLINLIPYISKFLKDSLKLTIHPKKIAILKYTQGVDFLGYISFPSHTLIRKRTKRRAVRKINEKIILYKSGNTEKKKLEATLCSYLGALSHANAYRFSEKLKNDYFLSVNNPD